MPEVPRVELATQDWVLKEMSDTERRIEKAFKDQTMFVSDKVTGIERAFHEQTQTLQARHDSLIRWMIGIGLALIIAVLVQPYLGG